MQPLLVAVPPHEAARGAGGAHAPAGGTPEGHPTGRRFPGKVAVLRITDGTSCEGAGGGRAAGGGGGAGGGGSAGGAGGDASAGSVRGVGGGAHVWARR